MILFTLLAIFQGLTVLLFIQSSACYNNTLIYIMAYNPKIYPNECTWDSGTRIGMASTILYVMTVICMYLIPAPGTRPKERPFPMMVWDTATDSNKDKNNNDDDDDNDDDDSVTSFADDEYDVKMTYKPKRHIDDEDLTETDVSYYDGNNNDDNDDI
jgi:hypothetical protein